MNELQGKNILIGVTGGIAAYKIVEVVSGKSPPSFIRCSASKGIENSPLIA